MVDKPPDVNVLICSAVVWATFVTFRREMPVVRDGVDSAGELSSALVNAALTIPPSVSDSVLNSVVG